jgi:hypothetical protein
MADLFAAEIREHHLGVVPLLSDSELMSRILGLLKYCMQICQITVHLASLQHEQFPLQLIQLIY